ncbi:MAG TPA: hypothetical protein VFB36_01910 [Nevskiaceae bacterium]|nr:hypothetical protein [Nevskiaceae bacterium]
MRAARIASLLIAGLTLNPIAARAFAPELTDLDSVPLALVRAPLAKRIELAATKSLPFQFAVKAPLSIDLRDGLWDSIDRDTARWRVRVRSPGAQSLSLELARFQLPASAALWIYDDAGELVQGPYTSADRSSSGRLWTALVLGEEAVIELRVASGDRDAVALELASVGHGFRGFGKDEASPPAKSGSCNVDAACPQGDPWRSEIRSVARISIDSTFFCSGQALNDAQQDNAPLFITANHCGIGQSRCGTSGDGYCDPSSVVFYWNFQNSSCRPSTGASDRNGNGSLSQNQQGATILAADVGSDFTLLRLGRAPDPAFNVYMAGWNATGNVPQSGIAIHHPDEDEKALSLFDAPAERADTCIEGSIEDCRRNVHAWGVHWSAGTTEQGSSGGGLWDERHLLVGWLSGGAASCSNPGGEDFFARMESAWTAGASDGQQLKHWLAPNSDAKSVCGRNRSAPSCDNSSAPRTEQRAGALDAWLLILLALMAMMRAAKIQELR